MSDLIIYGPQFSYFTRVICILCNYKSLAYELTLAPAGTPIAPFSEQHAELHPFKKLPVLIEGDLVLPETLAIADYLASKPGPEFLPAAAAERALCLSRANMIALYTHQALVENVLLEFAFPKGGDGTIRFEVVEQNLPKARQMLEWLQATLAAPHFYFGASFSLCDAYLVPMLDYLAQLPAPFNLVENYARLQEYLQHHRQQTYTQGVLGPRR